MELKKGTYSLDDLEVTETSWNINTDKKELEDIK